MRRVHNCLVCLREIYDTFAVTLISHPMNNIFIYRLRMLPLKNKQKQQQKNSLRLNVERR